MTNLEPIVTLLRALQRQFGDLSALATAKAQEQPETSSTHYRKLGEAAGLHTAWRTVADLADQLAEGVISIHTPGGDQVAQASPPAGATGGAQ